MLTALYQKELQPKIYAYLTREHQCHNENSGSWQRRTTPMIHSSLSHRTKASQFDKGAVAKQRCSLLLEPLNRNAPWCLIHNVLVAIRNKLIVKGGGGAVKRIGNLGLVRIVREVAVAARLLESIVGALGAVVDPATKQHHVIANVEPSC